MNLEASPAPTFLSQRTPLPPPPPKEEEAPRVRFTQISPMPEDQFQQSGLYALDENGRIWFLNHVSRSWWHIPSPKTDDKSLNVYRLS